MLMDIFHRCMFCKSHVDTKPVLKWGIYGGLDNGKDWYHDECIRQICADPEGAGHILVDKALDVIDRLEMEKKIHNTKIANAEKACKEIRERCV